MKILYVFPSRSRPEKFFNCMNNIKELSASDNYQILVKGDVDDPTMNNADVWNWLSYNHFGKYNVVLDFSKNKVHAINRDIDKASPEWGILICMSDDMKFEVKGFDNIIRFDMLKNFPDLDGVLHYNDGIQKSNVMTMSIMGRKYYERFWYIYHPDYTSVWSDFEATEVAYMLGKYKYMGNDNIIFRHLHPRWELSNWDEQYKKNESDKTYEIDKIVLNRHRANKYGLSDEQLINSFKYATL